MARSGRASTGWRRRASSSPRAAIARRCARALQGDASTRSYERLALGDKHAILMNSPRRPDGPPVRDGKPYSAIAHLADNVAPFVAMANGLRQYGFSAPAIHHADLDQGLLIIEDLGDERVVSGDPPAPIKERYETAVDVLLALHEQQLPDTLAGRAACRAPHSALRHRRLPDRGRAAARLVPAAPRRRHPGHASADSFRALWRELLQPAIDAPADLGAARLPFAQSALAAAPQRDRPARAFSTSRTR